MPMQHGDYAVCHQYDINEIADVLVNGYIFSRDNEACVAQTEFVCYHGQQRVHFVGKYEKIDEDFAIICRTLGRDGIKLKNINYSRQDTGGLTADSARRLERFYAEDMEVFQYDRYNL